MRTVFTPEHEMFRDSVRRFADEHVVPHYKQWEKDGGSPPEIWRLAGKAGLLCTGIPAEYGGADADFGYAAVLMEEMARANAPGLSFTLHSEVVAPYVLTYATEEAKRKWLPKMASGEMISAIAMTEPGAGSDLKAITTTARREGDEYVINGQKTFISNGSSAGLVIVAATTDRSLGRKGVTLIGVETDRPGFKPGRKLEKIGLHTQDTSELFFDNVRVPVSNRLGEEGAGFGYLMTQLAKERLVIAIRATAMVEHRLTDTIAYVRERMVFGQRLIDMQNTKFKLADAKAKVEMLRTFVDDCLAEFMRGELTPERAAMAKLVSTEIQNQLIDEFLQLHGGYGYMAEYAIGQAWVDARVMRIYGGSSEIMREIIARTL